MFVDVSIVLTGAERSVLLFDEEERRGLRRVRGSYLARGKVFVEEGFGGLPFVRGQRVKFAYFRHE